MMPELRVLTGHEMQAIPQPDGVKWPQFAEFVGAFDEQGKLVGRIGVLRLAHLEGTWVDVSYRKTMLPYRMFRFCEGALKERGLTHVFAFSADPVITNYLERLGYRQEGLVVLSKEL